MQAFQTRSTNSEILNALSLAIPPVVRSLYGSTSISTELAPLLMRILSPNLKPVRPHRLPSNLCDPGVA